MSGIKGGCGGGGGGGCGGGGGSSGHGQGGGSGKNPCVQVDPCQTTPTPVQCGGTVDPCQGNQPLSIGVGCICGCGSASNCGRGGQISHGCGGTKK